MILLLYFFVKRHLVILKKKLRLITDNFWSMLMLVSILHLAICLGFFSTCDISLHYLPKYKRKLIIASTLFYYYLSENPLISVKKQGLSTNGHVLLKMKELPLNYGAKLARCIFSVHFIFQPIENLHKPLTWNT